MRGEEVALVIKEAIKTIAVRGDLRKVSVMFNAFLIHLLLSVCDVCVFVSIVKVKLGTNLQHFKH